MPGQLRTEIHLGGTDTEGAFCLLIDEPPPGWSLPAHRHRNEAETIHFVAGTFEMIIDGEPSVLRAGQSVHIPRGVLHSSANLDEKTGRRIVIFSPAGLERFFREVGAASPEMEIDRIAALASATRHGWVFAIAARRLDR
jgi:mannose-6-phosphate isomerase-like protein (cupin superfamily)